jgi:hypothetical protein
MPNWQPVRTLAQPAPTHCDDRASFSAKCADWFFKWISSAYCCAHFEQVQKTTGVVNAHCMARQGNKCQGNKCQGNRKKKGPAAIFIAANP